MEEKAEYNTCEGFVDDTQLPGTLEWLLRVDEKEVETSKKHWVGMPEFIQEDNKPYKTILLHFRTKEDFENFVEKYKILDVEQKITQKTKYIYYPFFDVTKNSLLSWIVED